MNYVVIGLGFGDEGKGSTVDALCGYLQDTKEESVIVCRFSGGQQAGHTVVYKGVKHTFSNFGAGTLRGIPTYWSEYCTVDPIGVLNEYEALKTKGVIPRLFIDSNSPITTPYDKNFNRSDPETLKNGTCGVGFGATIVRQKNNFKLTMGDLLNDSILKIKLDAIKSYYNSEDSYEEFLEDCKDLLKIVRIEGKYICSMYSNIVFEGSQGILLDMDYGFFPHVTHSKTTTENIHKILGRSFKPIKDTEVFLVTRAYQTRHGNGPMTNEHIPFKLESPDEANVENTYQGKFRKTILDLDLLKYSSKFFYKDLKGNCKVNLVVTCLDQIKDNWKVTNNGGTIKFSSEDDFIESIKEVIKLYKVFRSHSPSLKGLECL